MLRLALAALLLLPGAGYCAEKAPEAVSLHLSKRAERHVRESHFAGGKLSRGKSLFDDGVDLSELLEAGREIKPRRQKNGRDKRVGKSKKPIGTDGRTRRQLKTYVIIAEPDGEVVTMYPGR